MFGHRTICLHGALLPALKVKINFFAFGAGRPARARTKKGPEGRVEWNWMEKSHRSAKNYQVYQLWSDRTLWLVLNFYTRDSESLLWKLVCMFTDRGLSSIDWMLNAKRGANVRLFAPLTFISLLASVHLSVRWLLKREKKHRLFDVSRLSVLFKANTLIEMCIYRFCIWIWRVNPVAGSYFAFGWRENKSSVSSSTVLE